MATVANQLGMVVKSARLEGNLTRNVLAARLHISARYLMAIENNQQKPSFDLLFRLIRELNLPADIIFYPEFKKRHPKLAKLEVLLLKCSEKELNVLFATVQSLLSDMPQEAEDRDTDRKGGDHRAAQT